MNGPSTEGTTPEAIEAWVRQQALFATDAPVRVRPLLGGVSSEVFDVQAGDTRMVVKRAGPYMLTDDVWPAAPRRVVHEGEVLRALGSLTPGAVAPVLAIDEGTFTIAMQHAPPSWTVWKSALLEGDVDPGVGARLGSLLGTWHQRTLGDERFSHLDDYELFEQLRLSPYLTTTAQRCPGQRASLEEVEARVRATRTCLVHGDFSPKNILLGDEGLWALDCEVAHIGDPQFDLAFMLNHLLMKALHRPASSGAYRLVSQQFTTEYTRAAPDGGEVDGEPLCGLLAALLLARVHGKSPAEYLDGHGRARAEALSTWALERHVDALDDIWDRLEESAP